MPPHEEGILTVYKLVAGEAFPARIHNLSGEGISWTRECSDAQTRANLVKRVSIALKDRVEGTYIALVTDRHTGTVRCVLSFAVESINTVLVKPGV